MDVIKWVRSVVPWVGVTPGLAQAKASVDSCAPADYEWLPSNQVDFDGGLLECVIADLESQGLVVDGEPPWPPGHPSHAPSAEDGEPEDEPPDDGDVEAEADGGDEPPDDDGDDGHTSSGGTVTVVAGAPSGLAPWIFTPPLLTPTPNGLYASVTWDPEQQGTPTLVTSPRPARFLAGVQFWPANWIGGFGTWDEPRQWCDGEQTKRPEPRPDPEDPFDPIVAWAADECDMTAASREEIRTNVEQTLKLREQQAIEAAFATRLVADAAGAPSTSGDIITAIGFLEEQLAATGVGGVIHAAPHLAASLAAALVAKGSAGGRLLTPLNHPLVFGAGYADELADTLIATTPLFGWRTEIEVRETFDTPRNLFYAIAERAVVVGYERMVAKAHVDA